MLYGQYLKKRYKVNRRYQRKLVWTVEEKQRLIDSLIKGLPIPLFLVAEIGVPPEAPYELIDGLQRLNAIFSFLENEYPVNGDYFDLDSLADTKLRKDAGELEQKAPIQARLESVRVANYTVALSIYRAVDSSSIDEVFRRVNSGGRRLLRQALRQAGTISPLADLVRLVSSEIRTDTSPGDVVPLELMPRLSITNRDLPYGVPADDIFWVREGILRRDEVRASQDEQAVLDLLIDCLVSPMPNSGTRIRDDYYDFSLESSDAPTPESRAITEAIFAYGAEKLRVDFMRVYDEIRAVLSKQQLRFSALIQAGSGGRAPRYFHVVFMAFYELMFQSRQVVRDRSALAVALVGIGKNAAKVPSGGGDWNKTVKRKSIDAVKGVIGSCFETNTAPEDYSRYGWGSQLETILGNAVIEQPMFDCKQGFLQLEASRTFDEDSFEKICRTLTAMANRGPGAVGHVAAGIADNESDAKRILEIDGVRTVVFKGFNIVGIGREAVAQKKSLSDYHTWLGQRLRTSPSLDRRLAAYIATEMRLINYEGLPVLLLRVEAQVEPVFFKGELYVRSGTETVRVEKADYMRIFKRFAQAGTASQKS